MDDYIQKLNERLDRLEHLTLIAAKSVLDIDEAATLTGFTKGFLYRLTSTRQIPHYKKNRKLYFQKGELEKWMLEQRVMTSDQIDSLAATHIAITKRKSI